MSQALLISNETVINHLYEVNLKAYVATNVTIKKNLNDAIKLLENSPNIDAIITFKQINGIDLPSEIYEFLKNAHLNIPIIVVDEYAPKVGMICLKNRYQLKSLIQAMAKILEITAQDMANLEVPKFYPIPIKLIKELPETPTDLYYRNKKNEFEFDYYKVHEKEKNLGESLKNFASEGVEFLYINAIERLKFINKASGIILDELQRSDLSVADRVVITAQGMDMVADEIFEGKTEINAEIAKISKACIESVNIIIRESPKLKNLLSDLLDSKQEYVYIHSLVTAFIASQIVEKMPWGSNEQAEKIAFALFFHDLYLLPVYKKYPEFRGEEELLHADEVTEEDKKILMDHAKLSGDLLKTFPRAPIGADMIVTQHHGMINGVGFAINYKDDISPLSKIMMISETVSEEVLKSYDQGKNEVDKEKILEKLNQKFRTHTYKKIIQTVELINI
jgi:HD-GYP domain-containing protein (c-di-GMP phosphodiesterase class II)